MNITRGRVPCGQKVVIYGVEGIGKTTLAAQFPGAVFIDTEGSTRNFDVARFDPPTSWPMLRHEVEYAMSHPEEVGTIIIDTADWAERLSVADVCQRNKWDSIESPGYGRGYAENAENFGRLLDLLDRVCAQHINVVFTAHATIRKVESPTEFGTYDKYELKCSKQVSPMLKEWADMVLFCNYDMMIVTEQGKKTGKAQGGQRMMYANHCPAYDAKNRHGLPDRMPMEYSQIAHIFGGGQAVPAQSVQTAPVEVHPANPTQPSPAATSGEQGAAVTEAQTSAGAASSFHEVDPFTGEDLFQGIYPPLADLMRASQVTPFEVQEVIHSKGVMPTYDNGDYVPVSVYPEDLCRWIMSNWQKFIQYVTEPRDNLPFE